MPFLLEVIQKGLSYLVSGQPVITPALTGNSNTILVQAALAVNQVLILAQQRLDMKTLCMFLII